MRGEGVLASTWWFGRCALTRSPGCPKGPSQEWKKMCILVYIYCMHRKTSAILLELCISIRLVHFKACIQMVT
jgi:hypothetical protein